MFRGHAGGASIPYSARGGAASSFASSAFDDSDTDAVDWDSDDGDDMVRHARPHQAVIRDVGEGGDDVMQLPRDTPAIRPFQGDVGDPAERGLDARPRGPTKAEKDVARSLMAATTPDEVLQVFEEDPDEFDTVNLATAVHRLAKLVIDQRKTAAGRAQAQARRQRHRERRLRRMQALKGQVGGRRTRAAAADAGAGAPYGGGSSSSSGAESSDDERFAVSRFGGKGQGEGASGGADDAVGAHAEASARGSSTALAWPKDPEPERVEALMVAVEETLAAATRGRVPPPGPRSLASIAWGAANVQKLRASRSHSSWHDAASGALARASDSGDALFDAVALHSLRQLDDFNPADMAQLTFGYHRARKRHEGLFRQAAPHVARRVAAYSPHELSSILTSYASVRVQAPALFEAAGAEVVRRSRECNPQTLVTAANALAKAAVLQRGKKPAAREGTLRAMEGLVPAIKEQVRTFTPQGVAITAWAYATVSHRDDELFDLLARVFKRPSLLRAANAQNLANAARSFAAQPGAQHIVEMSRAAADAAVDEADLEGVDADHARGAQLYERIAHAAVRELEAGRLDAHSACELLESLAVVGVAPPTAVRALSNFVSESAALLTTVDLSKALWAHSKMGLRQPPLFAAACEGRTAQRLVHRLSTPAVGRTMWAFATQEDAYGEKCLPLLIHPTTSAWHAAAGGWRDTKRAVTSTNSALRLYRAVGTQLMKRATEMRARQIVDCLDSFASLGAEVFAFAAWAARHVEIHASSFSGRQLATACVALAQLGVTAREAIVEGSAGDTHTPAGYYLRQDSDAGVWAAVDAAALQRLETGHLKVADHCDLVWALVAANVPVCDSAFLREALSVRALRRLAQAAATGSVTPLSLARLREAHSAAMLEGAEGVGEMPADLDAASLRAFTEHNVLRWGAQRDVPAAPAAAIGADTEGAGATDESAFITRYQSGPRAQMRESLGAALERVLRHDSADGSHGGDSDRDSDAPFEPSSSADDSGGGAGAGHYDIWSLSGSRRNTQRKARHGDRARSDGDGAASGRDEPDVPSAWHGDRDEATAHASEVAAGLRRDLVNPADGLFIDFALLPELPPAAAGGGDGLDAGGGGGGDVSADAPLAVAGAVAVLPADPACYLHGSRVLTTEMRLRVEALRAAGWRVVVVPYWDWRRRSAPTDKLGLRAPRRRGHGGVTEDRDTYLRRQLSDVGDEGEAGGGEGDASAGDAAESLAEGTVV